MSRNNLFIGWVTNAWRKEDADQAIIRLQMKFILILCALCTALLIGWMRSPSDITVHIPPDIQNGATMKVGTIPTPLIYSFAYEVWQQVNSWPKDGEIDYKKNIQDYWAYFTPQFKSELLENYADQKLNGQLQRVRYIQGVSGAAYDATNVRKIGNDTWEVSLKMHVTEYKNSQVVKDVDVLYPLKVARVNIATNINPYGLAVTGFSSEPQRIDNTI